MAEGKITIAVESGGKHRTETVTKTFDHPNNYEGISLAAGKEVTDWVNTAANTAACNLPADHGYSNGKFHVFWDGGCRYDVDGTIATNALTLDGGSGDDFPATATEDIVVCPPQQINLATDGDAMAFLAAFATGRCDLYFEDAAGDAIGHLEVPSSTEPVLWHDTDGFTNPLTGDPVTVCWAANGTTSAVVLDVLIGEDSTP